jgi:hypothetical protein
MVFGWVLYGMMGFRVYLYVCMYGCLGCLVDIFRAWISMSMNEHCSERLRFGVLGTDTLERFMND